MKMELKRTERGEGKPMIFTMRFARGVSLQVTVDAKKREAPAFALKILAQAAEAAEGMRGREKFLRKLGKVLKGKEAA